MYYSLSSLHEYQWFLYLLCGGIHYTSHAESDIAILVILLQTRAVPNLKSAYLHILRDTVGILCKLQYRVDGTVFSGGFFLTSFRLADGSMILCTGGAIW